MNDIIHLLPDAVANQIAAGEVIQRPASVVKELLENSIDAGGTSLQLIVKDAGRTLIQVIDNGKGMSFNDARLCFERHATSKLSKSEDLFKITTKGFRGEAMASIAAIAHVEMKTKQQEETNGTLILMEGSTVKVHEVIATQQDGTSVSVKNLFFNVPARRNFLKSDAIEMTHIEEEFYRVALIHHNIAFTLYHNGKILLQLQPTNFKQRIINIFGQNFKDKLFPVEQDTDFMRISGFIAKPENAKKKKSEQYMFINHRYIRHNLLNYAIETAYSELIPQGYRPAYFIDIEINPACIDINISPTKVEVKLQDEKLMFGFLNSTVKKSLGMMSLTPQLDFDTDSHTFIPKMPKNIEIIPPTLNLNPDYNPFDAVKSASKSNNGNFTAENSWNRHQNLGGWEDFLKGIQRENVTPDSSVQLQSPELNEPIDDRNFASENIPEDFPFFIADNRYIFLQLNHQVIIVDIIHARERILYDQYLDALQNKPISVQQSLFPTTITLTPALADLAETLKDDLHKLGYDMEKMDNTHFVINGTPTDIEEEGDLQSIIENVLNDFKTNQFLHKSDKDSNVALSLARQKRARFIPMKQPTEVRTFLQQLFQCHCSAITPSQKSIFHIMGGEELHRYFD